MFIEITHQQWINDYAVDTGRVTLLGGEQTRAVLDAQDAQEIRDFISGDRGNLSSDFGDTLAYTAQDAGWANIDGPFYVRIQHRDEAEVVEALERYLEDREQRGVPEEGDESGLETSGLEMRVQQIKDLLEALPEDAREALLDEVAPRWPTG